MKTLINTLGVVLILCFSIAVAMASEQVSLGHTQVWTGFSDGRVCITIQDSIDRSAARAELWLVSHNSVEWVDDMEGYSCFELDVDEDTEIHALTYDPRIVITVVTNQFDEALVSGL